MKISPIRMPLLLGSGCLVPSALIDRFFYRSAAKKYLTAMKQGLPNLFVVP